MTIKEILEIENANTDRINLFKEGIFWRMCYCSFFFFLTFNCLLLLPTAAFFQDITLKIQKEIK
jgi:hypothetical protein